MPNPLVKLIWLIIALSSFFSGEYLGIHYLFLLGAFALYRYLMIEIVECVVAGTTATLEQFEARHAEIEDVMMEDVAEPAVLDSNLFRQRLHRFEEVS